MEPYVKIRLDVDENNFLFSFLVSPHDQNILIGHIRVIKFSYYSEVLTADLNFVQLTYAFSV